MNNGTKRVAFKNNEIYTIDIYQANCIDCAGGCDFYSGDLAEPMA